MKPGSSYDTVVLVFGVGASTVCDIVTDFSDAVLKNYFDKSLHFQTTEDEMHTNFSKRWDFPGELEAMDGSHIPIKRPKENGTDYHNYKGWNSTILLAAVDFSYTYINVGYPGKCHDAGIYQTSGLKDHIDPVEFPTNIIL